MRDNDYLAEIRGLIEANVEGLLAYELRDPPLAPGLEFYRQVLLRFHRGDAAGIAVLMESSDSLTPALRVLVALRAQILRAELDETFLQSLTGQDWAEWQGEISILLAAAYETLGDFTEAMRWHQRAAKELLKIGAKGKSLRARANMVANLSNLEPQRKLIPEYLYLYREARKLKQYNIMATTLLNLSREYQLMGALQVALRHCNRAIAACKGDLAGQIYFLAIAHRAHLLHDLERHVDARADYELASTSEFPAVRSACAVLAKIFGTQKQVAKPHLRTWEERLAALGKKNARLSALEENLLQFLAEKPREKFEITDHLFGKELHPLKAENRLKNLLHRLRHKLPGLVHLDGERYRLADPAQKGKAG